MGSLRVVVLVFVAGCLQAGLVPCGDLLCPSGSVCTSDGRCARPEQLTACDGLADGDACTFASGAGHCDRGLCVAAACGNGTQDPREACDDGNIESGDGCRADCAKVEMCGDGAIDMGEACDDANANPGDGCDMCVATQWRPSLVVGGTANATSIGLAYPSGIAVDRRGNVYVADSGSARVRRIDTSGVATTVAGTGLYGYSGDGGPGTAAQVWYPMGVAVDELGGVYIADTGSNRIRYVDPRGIIATIAGTGTAGYNGDNQPAVTAQVSGPQGIAVDGLGNIYIGDTNNHRVRMIDVTGTITTIAGTGVSGFSGEGGPATSAQMVGPAGITLDDSGNIFVADTNDGRVRRFTIGGNIITVAGDGTSGDGGDGGPAIDAQLEGPQNVAFDAAGNMYIAGNYNYRVRKVAPDGTITTFAGTDYGYGGDGGPATSALMTYPMGVAVGPTGDVFITDERGNRVRKVDPTGVITTYVGSGSYGTIGDGGDAMSSFLDAPRGITFDPAGNIYVADEFEQRVRRIDPTGVIQTFAGSGAADTYGFAGDGGPATQALIDGPNDVAADAAGNIYITDNYNQRIRKVNTQGIITTIAGSGNQGFGGDNGPALDADFDSPTGIAVDAAGNVYVADTGNHRIRKIDTAGMITTVAGTTEGFSGDNAAATAAKLSSPQGVSVDGTTLLVADTGNGRIRRISATGIITTVAGGGPSLGDNGPATSALLSGPYDAVAMPGGGFVIADHGNARFRAVDANGKITTIAGTGGNDFAGDGGPGTAAVCSEPEGVAVGPDGDIYLVDSALSGHIRRLHQGVITTVAGTVDPEGMGPLLQGRSADPRALVIGPDMTLVAGGNSGTLQAIRTGWLEVVAGRYPQPASIGNRARFRDRTFGTVAGVAADFAAGIAYITVGNSVLAITMVDPNDRETWTIAPFANVAGTEGFAEGAVATARFRAPTGLYLDAAAHQLYVADTGNHSIRVIDLSAGTVSTIIGTPATLGFAGDGGSATAALLYQPQAITRCANGDLFVADTGNNRVRRVDAATKSIQTVLGVGVAASSGEGAPASTFPVDTPLGLACDDVNNLYVTSTTSVRVVPSHDGIVDDTSSVQTIYGASPRERFPDNLTRCLTGIAVIDGATLRVLDSCTGFVIELRREAAQ